MGGNRFQFSDGQNWDDVPEFGTSAPAPQTSKPKLRIGELLVKAGLLNQQVIDDSAALADRMHLPLPRVLSMNGYITEDTLGMAMTVLEYINDDKLVIDSGVKVLELMKNQGLTLEEAMTRITALPSVSGVQASLLGDLLRESAAANHKQIENAIVKGLDAAVPIGQVLLNTQLISKQLLKSCLIALKMLNQGLATREQVLQALRAARLRKVFLFEPLKEIGAITEDPDLEDPAAAFLQLSGLLSEYEYLSALEVHVTEHKEMDDALIGYGLATSESMAATRELVAMVNEGALEKEQALHLLRKLVTVNWDIARVLEEIDGAEEEELSVEVGELLKSTGLIHPEDMEIAVKQSLEKRQPLTTTLLETGFMSEQALESAKGLSSLVEQRMLTMEQARITLAYSHENEVGLEEALTRFGWMPAMV